ncbi:RNA polymerase sigma factor [Paenibacillus sp. TH7-28]
MCQLSTCSHDFIRQICEQYYAEVYQFCKHLVKNDVQFRDVVEDCTQETFLLAGKHAEKLKSHPCVKGWLFSTAKNLVRKSFRTYGSKQKHEAILADNTTCSSPSAELEMEWLQDSQIDIENMKADILVNLKDQEYALYLDYFVHKKTVAEISASNEISHTATTTRICRLRKSIKQIVSSVIESEQ